MQMNLLSAIFLFALSACVEVRDPEEKKSEKTDSVSKVSYEIRSLPQEQRYAVLIKGVGESEAVSRTIVGATHVKSQVTLTAHNSEVEDIAEEAGLYEYRLRNEILRVEIPRDLVINGDHVLKTEETQIESKGRLYFKAGSVLTTEGQKINWRFQSVISEGAILQTFKEGQKAVAAVNGRSGGSVLLSAESLQGTLHIHMRGENGGDGEYWMNQKHFSLLDLNGKNGGNTGELNLAIADTSQGAFVPELFPGEGGRGTEVKSFNGVTLRARGEDGAVGIKQMPVIRKR